MENAPVENGENITVVVKSETGKKKTFSSPAKVPLWKKLLRLG